MFADVLVYYNIAIVKTLERLIDFAELMKTVLYHVSVTSGKAVICAQRREYVETASLNCNAFHHRVRIIPS